MTNRAYPSCCCWKRGLQPASAVWVGTNARHPMSRWRAELKRRKTPRSVTNNFGMQRHDKTGCQLFRLTRPSRHWRGVGAERRGATGAAEASYDGRPAYCMRPRRYEDRTQIRPIADLALGQPATARGKSSRSRAQKRWRAGSKSVFEFILEDGTALVALPLVDLPFMEKYFHPGDEVLGLRQARFAQTAHPRPSGNGNGRGRAKKISSISIAVVPIIP